VRDMSASFDRFWNDKLAYPVERLLDEEDLEKLRKWQPPGNDPQKAAQPTAPAPRTAAEVLPAIDPVQLAEARRKPLDLRTVELVWAPSVLMVDEPGKIGPGDDACGRHSATWSSSRRISCPARE
jgi:cardiolipin synthase C